MNTIIDSVQKEEPKRASPLRVERAYIRAYIKDRPKVDPNMPLDCNDGAALRVAPVKGHQPPTILAVDFPLFKPHTPA